MVAVIQAGKCYWLGSQLNQIHLTSTLVACNLSPTGGNIAILRSPAWVFTCRFTGRGSYSRYAGLGFNRPMWIGEAMNNTGCESAQERAYVAFTIVLSAIYAVFRFAANQSGPIWPFGTSDGMQSLWMMVEILIVLVSTATMVTGTRYNLWAPADWGLRLDKGIVIVGVVFGVLSVIVIVSQSGTFGPDDVRTSVTGSMRITSGELLLRALLVSCLLSRLGHSRQKVIVVMMLCGLVITMVRWPDTTIMGKDLALAAAVQALLCYFYYASGSVFVTMIFPIFPGDSIVSDYHNPLFGLALYFVLALAAKYVGGHGSNLGWEGPARASH